MNTTVSEAVELARKLRDRLTSIDDVEVVVFPPFTNLEAVGKVIGDSSLQLGAQDVFWENQGAYTGEISSLMLLSLGVRHVIVGHSERRHILGESNEVVNRKARAALAAGLRVILAIGETAEERSEGRTEAVLERQLAESTADIGSSILGSVVIAYEPVWAIGTGVTATPAQAQEAHAFIRAWLGRRFDANRGDKMRIQYGGSVTPANASELLGQPDVDGALVGGASLKPDDFAAIVQAQRAAFAPC